MIFKTGNMLDEMPSMHNMVVVTANSNVKYGDRLVMGAGAARDLKNKVKGIDHEFGRMVKEYNSLNEEYLLLFHNFYGILQVKYNWWEDADVDLIKRSLKELKHVACKNENTVFNLNYPGIGYGGIEKNIVETILVEMKLPDNISIWRL